MYLQIRNNITWWWTVSIVELAPGPDIRSVLLWSQRPDVLHDRSFFVHGSVCQAGQQVAPCQGPVSNSDTSSSLAPWVPVCHLLQKVETLSVNLAIFSHGTSYPNFEFKLTQQKNIQMSNAEHL